MKTEIIKIDPMDLDYEKIKFAAEIIKNGGLVVFPTETVYGLGANALDERAVNSIFQAKGRPSDNPLIAHIALRSQIDVLVKVVDSTAELLMQKFWPGPTLVMKKADGIPDVVTAGLDTIAVRIPHHPVALALIKEVQMPIAAPSANRSGRPSPTEASHVIEDLYGFVDLIIDSGSTRVGIESTVLDISTKPPMVLRPGGITVEQLRDVVGEVLIDPTLSSEANTGQLQESYDKPRSPGMKYKHYSPKAEIVVVSGQAEKVIEKICELARISTMEGKKTAVLVSSETQGIYEQWGKEKMCVMPYGSREDKETIAANLFALFRKLDEENVNIAYVEAVDESGIGMAIMNRINKASGYNIIRLTDTL